MNDFFFVSCNKRLVQNSIQNFARSKVLKIRYFTIFQKIVNTQFIYDYLVQRPERPYNAYM